MDKIKLTLIKNKQYGFYNIEFSRRPDFSNPEDKELLDELKNNGWAYSSRNKCWYPRTYEAQFLSETFALEIMNKYGDVHNTGYKSTLNENLSSMNLSEHFIEEMKNKKPTEEQKRAVFENVPGSSGIIDADNHHITYYLTPHSSNDDFPMTLNITFDHEYLEKDSPKFEMIRDFLGLQTYEADVNSGKYVSNSEPQIKNNADSYTNQILDKIRAAGIEVVTDKDEFDRILKEEETVQKMSFNKNLSFSEQIEAVLSNNFPIHEHLKVCETPTIFIDVGCKKYPILYTQEHLKDALHPKSPLNDSWHGLTKEQIIQVPRLLSTPAFLVDDPKYNNIISILPLVDNDNAPVFCIIKPNGKGMYDSELVNSNFMLSIFGKDNQFENYLNHSIKHKNILYWNKKKSQELFRLLGHQLTQNLNNLGSDRILHKSKSFVNDNAQKMTLHDGTTYGFVHNGKIYLNPELINSNSAVHEYTHLWDAYVQKTNPELWGKGLEIFRNTKYWNEVISDPNYQDIKDDENLVLSEIHSRICGDMAEQVLNTIAELDGEKKKLDAIDWNKKTWEYITASIGWDIAYSGKVEGHLEEIYSNDIFFHEFLSTPMKDLIASKKINVSKELSWKELKDFFNGIKTFRGDFDAIHSEVLGENQTLSESEVKEEVAYRLIEENIDFNIFAENKDEFEPGNEVLHSERMEIRSHIAEEIAARVVEKHYQNFTDIQNDVNLLINKRAENIVEKYMDEPVVQKEIETVESNHIDSDKEQSERKEKAKNELGIIVNNKGWKGIHSDEHLSTTEIAKKLREHIKENHPGYKFSVRTESYSMGSSLYVNLKEYPVELSNYELMKSFIEKEGDRNWKSRYFKNGKEFDFRTATKEEQDNFINDRIEAAKNWSINEHTLEDETWLNPEIMAVLKDVIKFDNSYNYNYSDSYTDYYDYDHNFTLGIEDGKQVERKIIQKKEKKQPVENNLQPKNTEATTAEVVINEAHNIPNLKFNGKPSEEIRNKLKSEGWTWNNNDGVWWPRTKEAQANAQKFAEGVVDSYEKPSFVYEKEDELNNDFGIQSGEVNEEGLGYTAESDHVVAVTTLTADHENYKI